MTLFDYNNKLYFLFILYLSLLSVVCLSDSLISISLLSKQLLESRNKQWCAWAQFVR